MYPCIRGWLIVTSLTT